ncbi:MAG TPA: hypothetical protein VGT41_02535 [Candidatus Babeliales bacterium]|nr:hypothetical protein [Candidatus Babeliales bacterium]
MNSKKNFFTTLRNLFAFILCATTSLSATQSSQEQPEVWINVFVHGIMSVKPHIGITNFLRFMTDRVESTIYSETVRVMRDDHIFYQNQAMQDLGLHPMDPSRIEVGNSSGAMAAAFEIVSQFVNPNKTIINHYYTYGWSGLMSESKRYTDAINLYQSVAALVAQLTANGISPKVRIIGYSHGGNVVLNIAKVRQCEQNPLPLEVDEIILYGVPIQKETDYLVNDPMFKKIYHIYSRGDRIQKLDFFSFKRFFSHRIFKPRRGFTLPNKLIQIQIKCVRNLQNINDEKALKNYAFKNKSVLSGRGRYLRDSSPGHTELWFFGWTPQHYRKTFPLYPMPAAALTPLIVHYAQNFQERNRFEKPTLIDIRPDQEVVLIRNQKSRKILNLGRFLPVEEINNIKTTIAQYAPEDYTGEKYNGAIRTAYLQAQEWYRNKKLEDRLVRIHRKKERRLRKSFRKSCAALEKKDN